MKKSRATTIQAVILILVLACLLPYFAQAEKLTPVEPPAVKQFEIIDGTSSVTGEPGTTTAAARVNFSKACNEWKAETKDLNKASEGGKANQVLSMSCGKAECPYQENGSYVCTSISTYKLKIEGIKAPAVPVPSLALGKTETIVPISPPKQIVEITPAPQPGFIWIPGFWGWQNTGHIWYPGHWQQTRPGQIWIGHQWNRRGNGWHLETGRWGHGH